MPAWLLRGLCMGLLHAVAVTAIAQLTVLQPTGVDIAKAVSIALLVGAAALWSAIDSWLDRTDRGRNWFVAALIAAPVAGIFGVLGRAVFVDQTGINALGDAMTGGAAFTALLVLVPAGLGLFAGSRLRNPRGGAEDVADTGTDGDTSTGGDAGRHRGSSVPRTRRPRPVRPTPTPRQRG